MNVGSPLSSLPTRLSRASYWLRRDACWMANPSAVIVMIALSAYLSSKDDHIDMTAQDSVDGAGEDA